MNPGAASGNLPDYIYILIFSNLTYSILCYTLETDWLQVVSRTVYNLVTSR